MPVAATRPPWGTMFVLARCLCLDATVPLFAYQLVSYYAPPLCKTQAVRSLIVTLYDYRLSTVFALYPKKTRCKAFERAAYIDIPSLFFSSCIYKSKTPPTLVVLMCREASYLVRTRRLELPRAQCSPAPQADASTNSATSAYLATLLIIPHVRGFCKHLALSLSNGGRLRSDLHRRQGYRPAGWPVHQGLSHTH